MSQVVKDGAIVKVQGYEFIASEVVWKDETDQATGKPTGRRYVRFKGTCTENPINDGIRGTLYDGGTYGGNALAGYEEG